MTPPAESPDALSSEQEALFAEAGMPANEKRREPLSEPAAASHRRADVPPGWERVASHFPQDAHPDAMQAFLDGVSEELEIGGRLVTPFEWLSAGGDPDVVADLVDDAYRLD